MSPARSRLLALLALCVALGLSTGSAPVAHADADPPSDVLYLQDVFFPYQPQVSEPYRRRLSAIVRQARQQGVPVKVALIAGPADLGAIPMLLGHPQRYAYFLGQELNTRTPKVVLVVMSAGVGTFGASPAQRRALAGLRVPATNGADALARAGIDAVSRVAGAAGHPLAAPAPVDASAPARSGGGSGWLAFLPVAVVVLAGVGVTLRRRLGRGRG